MFPFRFWIARGRSWLRSPYGLPSPGPAPLPCSVIETYFEVTNSETAGPLIGENFISETVLFKTVAYLLKGHEVIHHYKADWLAHQELDIFVPSLNLAIEYQGEQHFMPIDAWGGDDALEKTQQRDEEKRRRCESKGIKLLYFDHTMELSEKFVARRLEEILAEQIAKKLA